MFDAQLGLVVGFILLAAVPAYNVIYSRAHYVISAITIAILLWYGVAVFYTIPTLSGWSLESDLPADAKIIGVRIVEPGRDDPGCFYFWLNESPQHKLDALNVIRPDKVFVYTGKTQPRAYKIPYDRELHKQLIEAMKRQKKQQGSSLTTGEQGVKGKRGTGGQEYKDNPPFKIVNPSTIMTKE